MTVILLDLNYTLVTNTSTEALARRIPKEIYDEDLIANIEHLTVILITARPVRWQAQTLAAISDRTGWSPDQSLFNDTGFSAPAAKKSLIQRFVLPKYDPSELFGIESNSLTRGMYKNHGIKSAPKAKVPWPLT